MTHETLQELKEAVARGDKIEMHGPFITITQKPMKEISLLRTQAEWLVDLLEDCDPKVAGSWRHDIASDVRQAFGMVARLKPFQQRVMRHLKRFGTTTDGKPG